MHAEEGRACGENSCEFFNREVKAPNRNATQMKVVKRKPKDAKATKAEAEPRRATKKSTLKKSRKWGGRSAY